MKIRVMTSRGVTETEAIKKISFKGIKFYQAKAIDGYGYSLIEPKSGLAIPASGKSRAALIRGAEDFVRMVGVESFKWTLFQKGMDGKNLNPELV